MTIDNSTKMALGLAAVGGAIKLYGQHSTTLSADKKTQYNTIGDYTLYSGLALVVLFYLSEKF
jgi:hypothetical protein